MASVRLGYRLKDGPAQCMDNITLNRYTTWNCKKTAFFQRHYLRNRSSTDTGVSCYIYVYYPSECSSKVWLIPPGTSCMYVWLCVCKVCQYGSRARRHNWSSVSTTASRPLIFFRNEMKITASSLKMKAIGSSKISVTTYQTTRSHSTKRSNRHVNFRSKHKSRVFEWDVILTAVSWSPLCKIWCTRL
jgi:hypothetical protein